MTTPLFRPEVVAAHAVQHLGGIRVGHNPRFALWVVVSLLLAAALFAFAIWGEATRKVRVAGLLAPIQGSLNIATQAGGTLAEWQVTEGGLVQAGQTLAVIHTDRAGAQGEVAALLARSQHQRQVSLETEASLRQLQARQRQQGLADRIRALQSELAQAENEAALTERRVTPAQRGLLRCQQLALEGFVAGVQAQARQEEMPDQQARANAASTASARG